MTAKALAVIARLSVEIDDVTPRLKRCVEVPIDIRLDGASTASFEARFARTSG